VLPVPDSAALRCGRRTFVRDARIAGNELVDRTAKEEHATTDSYALDLYKAVKTAHGYT